MEMKMQGCVLLVLLCAVAQGKVFDRCDWARLLKKHGMDNYNGISLADWVCMTAHVSNFDTKATKRNANGSTDYGIFQINSRYWCKDGGENAVNSCGIKCSALLCDNQTAAIKCAKRFVQDTGGIGAWSAWGTHCQGKDLSSYLHGCGL